MIPSDNDILMLMEMTARAERKEGFTGWGQPPGHFIEACRRLVEAGLAEERDGFPGWFRPTKAGAELVAPRIRNAH
jgi:hypothetical protein